MPTQSRSAIREAQQRAIENGDHTFIVSEPCANGHTSGIRYASNAICRECLTTYEARAKPPKERLLRLANADTKLVQLKQDSETARLGAVARKRFTELTGRPVSGSLIYKAAIVLLASHLRSSTSAADALSLIR